jgi:hypothetical protein
LNAANKKKLHFFPSKTQHRQHVNRLSINGAWTRKNSSKVKYANLPVKVCLVYLKLFEESFLPIFKRCKCIKTFPQPRSNFQLLNENCLREFEMAAFGHTEAISLFLSKHENESIAPTIN